MQPLLDSELQQSLPITARFLGGLFTFKVKAFPANCQVVFGYLLRKNQGVKLSVLAGA